MIGNVAEERYFERVADFNEEMVLEEGLECGVAAEYFHCLWEAIVEEGVEDLVEECSREEEAKAELRFGG